MKRFSHIVGTLLIVLLLSVSLIGCATTNELEKTEVKVEKEEVTTTCCMPVVETVEETSTYPYGVKMITKTQGDAKDFDLLVIHTNDVHGRIESSRGKTIGYARMATLIKEAKKITPNVLVLDAGDTLHGTTISNMFKGEVPMHLLDIVGYDAIAPGNHDYNYGHQRLEELSAMPKESNLKVLSANTTKDENNELVFQPYQLYKFNNFKVAVFGLTTPDVKTKSHPKNSEGISFLSPEVVEKAQENVNKLHEIADFVIAVGHVGLDDDGESLLTSTLIAEKINGIDLFIDGHSHTELPEGLQVNNTLIAQTGEYLKNLGVVKVHVENNKAVSEVAMLIPASEVLNPQDSELAKKYGVTEVKEDPEVKAYIDSEKERLAQITSQVIAELPMALQGEREYVRTRSTNLGRMLCKAMTSATGSDLTLTNGGGIRASLNAGPVTLGDVNTVLPFNNMAVVVKLTGQEIYDVMEKGFSKYPTLNGGFIQTDLAVRYDRRAEPGQRIKSLKLHGKAIDKNKEYLVATNDFLSAGGDGYNMLKKKPVKELESLEEVFANYLAENYPIGKYSK